MHVFFLTGWFSVHGHLDNTVLKGCSPALKNENGLHSGAIAYKRVDTTSSVCKMSGGGSSY